MQISLEPACQRRILTFVQAFGDDPPRPLFISPGDIGLDQAIDTTTPSGRLLFHVLAAISEFEPDLIPYGPVLHGPAVTTWTVGLDDEYFSTYPAQDSQNLEFCRCCLRGDASSAQWAVLNETDDRGGIGHSRVSTPAAPESVT
jgi:hypothetical protein